MNNNVWVIEAVPVATFGLEAAAFTSLAVFMLLFGEMCWAAGMIGVLLK